MWMPPSGPLECFPPVNLLIKETLQLPSDLSKPQPLFWIHSGARPGNVNKVRRSILLELRHEAIVGKEPSLLIPPRRQARIELRHQHAKRKDVRGSRRLTVEYFWSHVKRGPVTEVADVCLLGVHHGGQLGERRRDQSV